MQKAEDSDIDDVDFDDFKGIYYGDKTEKYQDPVTGCHFRYSDLCERLIRLKQQRKIIDKRLGLKTTSMIPSPIVEPEEFKFEPQLSNQDVPTTVIDDGSAKKVTGVLVK